MKRNTIKDGIEETIKGAKNGRETWVLAGLVMLIDLLPVNLPSSQPKKTIYISNCMRKNPDQGPVLLPQQRCLSAGEKCESAAGPD